ECVVGKFLDAATKQCVDCAAGYVRSSSNESSCSPCHPGRYANDTDVITGQFHGSSVCFTCNPGFYQPNNASGTCLQCPKGRFSETEGVTDCKDCQNGTYQNVKG